MGQAPEWDPRERFYVFDAVAVQIEVLKRREVSEC